MIMLKIWLTHKLAEVAIDALVKQIDNNFKLPMLLQSLPSDVAVLVEKWYPVIGTNIGFGHIPTTMYGHIASMLECEARFQNSHHTTSSELLLYKQYFLPIVRKVFGEVSPLGLNRLAQSSYKIHPFVERQRIYI